MATRMVKESAIRKMLKGKHISPGAIKYIDTYVYSMIEGLVLHLSEDDGRIQEPDVIQYLKTGSRYGL